MLGDPRAELLKRAICPFLAVIPARSVVDLDQIDPAHRRTFPIQDLIDQICRWFVSVKPRQNRPGIQAKELDYWWLNPATSHLQRTDDPARLDAKVLTEPFEVLIEVQDVDARALSSGSHSQVRERKAVSAV